MDTRQTTEKHRLLPSAKNDSVTSGQTDDSGQEEVRKATKRTELGENSVKRPEHSTERLQYSTEGPEYSTERLEYSTEGPEYSTERLEYSTEGPEYSTERLEYSTKGPEYSVARVLPDRELSSDTVVPPPRSKRKRLMLKQLSPSSGDISGVDRPSTSVDYLTKPRPFELTESRSVTTVLGASVTADGLQNATTKCNSVTSVGLAATSITTASGRAGSVTAGSVTAGIVTASSVTTSSVTAGSVTIACVTAGGAAGGSFSVLTSPGITKPKRQLSMPVLPTSLSPPISPTSVTSSKSSGSESPRDVNFNKPLLPSTAPPKPPVRRTSSSSGYLTTCLKTNTTKSEINTSPTRSVSTTIIPSNGSTTNGQTLNRQGSNSVNSVNSVNNDVINNDVGSLPCKHEDSYSPVVIRRKLTRLCFKDDDECVGFASLPEQVHRKAVKRGFDFTLMVVGETGLGKSTLITSLFLNPELYKDRKLLDASERVHKTVEIEKKYMEIEEKGVKLRLTIVDTPGFNDCMDAEQSWQPIEKYIIHQFDQYLKDESGLNRKNIKDHRVHCCLYFISPYGHGLRQIDITFIKRLQDKVNIVPIIAKADTLTPSEVRRLKERILEQIDEHRLQIYEFPDCDSDEDEDFKKQDAELKAAIPFAVIGSNTVVEVNGRKVRGRLYPWGVVEVDNPQHCDFTKLRMMLISTHMQDLKDVTRDVHYENFRANQIKEQLTKSQRERNSHCDDFEKANLEPNPADSKLKRDSSPNFECIMDQSQLLEQKEEEIRRMQEMIVKMQAQLQNSKRASSAVSNGSDNP